MDELENKDIPGHELRCVPHLAECFYNIINCQNEILMDAINKIMLKTRSGSSKVLSLPKKEEVVNHRRSENILLEEKRSIKTELSHIFISKI